jgi:transcription initiation factor IIE alpha subunit
MNLCDKDHQEVCFEGMNCPVCLERMELEEDRKKIERLENEIGELKEENDNLESRIYEIEKEGNK